MSHPGWLDRNEYPFEANYIDMGIGRMHYVDQGKGRNVVFVHGSPTWSFLYRNQIRPLSQHFRCIAPDHIGFGLSSKPLHWSYTAQGHANNLSLFLSHLDLKNITLVVHDFGGPIGLSYALRNARNVERIVILNTWMWRLDTDARMRRTARMLSTSTGRRLYQWLNFSPRVLLPSAYADRRNLTPSVHAHYLKPFSAFSERRGPWGLARSFTSEAAWYDNLWSQVDILSSIPALVIWGKSDRYLGKSFLSRWENVFRNCQVRELEKVGHFVTEEGSGETTAAILEFLTG